MNVWHWISTLQTELAEAGQAHSAELIERLTDMIANLEVERADALLPEAKALCKTLENPWLEIFIGHWEMRNRLGNKKEGETALADVISLFERAHRKETIDCPQSVCVTQDMSNCYANTDGPGWVSERIEVCDETLARIDPSWACYQCLSNEKAEALMDDARADEALAYLIGQEERLRASGEAIGPGTLEIHNTLLIALGRHAEALERIQAEEAAAEYAEWKNLSQPRTLLKVQALAGLERDEAAWAELPPLNEINPGDQIRWLRAAFPLLMRRPDQNTWELGSRLWQGLNHYATHGAHRFVIEMAERCIHLALRRGAAWSARRILALARTHQSKLRQDRGAGEKLVALSAEIDALPQDALPAPAEHLLEKLSAQGEDTPRDPEKEVQWLLLAVESRPEDTALREQAVSALQACGADQEAIDLLWEYVKTHTRQEETLAYNLLGALLMQDKDDPVEHLAQLYEQSAPLTALWCRAQLAKKRGDWPAAEKNCQALLERSNASHGARRLLAHSLMQQKRFAEAAACYRELSQAMEDPSVLWDYMTAASAAQDWAGVRDAARTLEMDLAPGAGPIDEDWGWIILRYTEDGESLEYYARRTGPVSAVILENAMGKRKQHVDDWVVFDAEALFPAPEDPDERKNFIPTFSAVHTLEPGGFGQSWLVDGPDPGDPLFDALREHLQERGWRVWVHSGGDYQVTDTQSDDAPLPGRYFSVALPGGVPAAALHQILLETTREWPHPPCWLGLAEHCGADAQVHEARIERYLL